MTEEKKDKKRQPVECASLIGPLWYIAWLFTIAFAKLGFWKAVLALLIWPYYLGNVLAG
jgi:cell division protein FtsX